MFVSCECLCCQVEVSATSVVCVWVWSRENKQPRHLLWVGGRGKDKETKHTRRPTRDSKSHWSTIRLWF
jgi:hypothetical protein